MKKQLIIRKAEEKDISAIADLEKVCFPHDPWSEESIRSEITSNPMALYIVAEEIETADYESGYQFSPFVLRECDGDNKSNSVIKSGYSGESENGGKYESGAGSEDETVHSTIAGYMGAWAVMDEGHIMNVAVNPDFRRRHIGEAILSCMLDVTYQSGVRSWTLEVRADNEPAKALYRKMGFEEAGIRKGYYEYDHTDAIIMWRTSE